MIEAKKEYTSQLQQILSPRIYERFKFIFDGTIEIIKKELSMNHIQNESVIKIFQKQLISVKDWNESSIIEEYERIKHRSKCNYLDKLIKAVIIANMKILSTIQYGGKRKSKIQVHIPTPTHFIHKCYIECAKEIYKNPYIFDMSSTSLSSKEKHQNLRDSLILIDNGIHSAIRQLLPISDLLEQNFNSDEEDEEEEKSTMSGGSEEESVRSRSNSSASETSSETSISSASVVSSLSSNSTSDEEEGSSEDEPNLEGGDGEEVEVKSVISGGSTQSSSSQSLGSKVGSVLNDQSIQDIDIRIGGDNETQTMLAGAVAERAEEHQTTFENSDISPISQQQSPQIQEGGASPSFLGALYNTFANSKNIKPDASDAPAPIKSVSQPSFMQTGGNSEEVKEIVYSGNAVPKGYSLATITQSQKPVQSQVTTEAIQQMIGGEKPLFDMSKSIYPPKISSTTSIKSNKSNKSQGKIIKTIYRPLGGQKSGLSLREMKYGNQLNKIKENDNLSVKSYGSSNSVKTIKSVKSVNSDDFHF